MTRRCLHCNLVEGKQYRLRAMYFGSYHGVVMTLAVLRRPRRRQIIHGVPRAGGKVKVSRSIFIRVVLASFSVGFP